jgi:hypothetical protein
MQQQRPPGRQQFFRFLRKLRAEGRSNMYGAVPYLMRSFGLDRERAFRIVCEWIDQQLELSSNAAPPAKSPRRQRVRHRAA